MGNCTDRGRIAFVCAMPMEARPLVRRLSLKKATLGALTVHAGVLSGRPVVATVTGMGTRLATDGIERLLGAVDVARVVVVGITGAIDKITPVATLIVPEIVMDGSTGIAYRPAPLGEKTPQGTMWTSDDLITDAVVLAELQSRGVVSLDMETAAIAKVCGHHRVDWSVFRAVSDRPDGTVDNAVFHLSNRDGTPNLPAVVRYVARHPSRIPGMIRLAQGARIATMSAADHAIRACRAL